MYKVLFRNLAAIALYVLVGTINLCTSKQLYITTLVAFIVVHVLYVIVYLATPTGIVNKSSRIRKQFLIGTFIHFSGYLLPCIIALII